MTCQAVLTGACAICTLFGSRTLGEFGHLSLGEFGHCNPQPASSDLKVPCERPATGMWKAGVLHSKRATRARSGHLVLHPMATRHQALLFRPATVHLASQRWRIRVRNCSNPSPPTPSVLPLFALSPFTSAAEKKRHRGRCGRFGRGSEGPKRARRHGLTGHIRPRWHPRRS